MFWLNKIIMFQLHRKNISNLKKNVVAFSNKCFNHDKKIFVILDAKNK
jgi:hypothetical protein